MILENIQIVNFKNIRSASIAFSPKINCLIGDNGAGKTNLLDAIYYLSFCKSALNAVDSQNITHDEGFFVVEGDYVHDDDNLKEHVYCGQKRGQKKHFKRNGKEYKRLSEHIGLIPIVFVSPSDSNLIGGGSEERRRFMDVVISQYDHDYLSHLSLYNKALQQRNSLLRQEEEPDGSLLDILEQEMGRHGEALYAKRREFVEQLIPVFQRIYQHISGCKEEVSLAYTSHCERGPLYEVISSDRAKDRIVGYSLHGVHRDDLVMLQGGYPVRHEGSQGQNKTFVLSLKLAQFDFLKRTSSATTPLLLLDDIFDKLDAYRVGRIVELVAGNAFGQIFITDTNRDALDAMLRDAEFSHKLFKVDNGVITEKEDD